MEDNYGFPLGARVILTKDDPCGYVDVGMVGTVCDHEHDGTYAYGCNIGVEWDDYHGSRYHDCCGKCELGHGRYVPDRCLELLNIDLGEIEANKTMINLLFDTTS